MSFLKWTAAPVETAMLFPMRIRVKGKRKLRLYLSGTIDWRPSNLKYTKACWRVISGYIINSFLAASTEHTELRLIGTSHRSSKQDCCKPLMQLESCLWCSSELDRNFQVHFSRLIFSGHYKKLNERIHFQTKTQKWSCSEGYSVTFNKLLS